MDKDDADRLRALAERLPSLISKEEAEKFAAGPATDPEFGGLLHPRMEGFRLELSLECPPFGFHVIGFTIDDEEGLTDRTRPVVRMIRDNWSTIWKQAVAAWEQASADEDGCVQAPDPSYGLDETTIEMAFADDVPEMAWQMSLTQSADAYMLLLTFVGVELADVDEG